jgi:hypothetical protein
MTTDEYENFFSNWKISTKGNYYGVYNDYVYVISDINHETKQKQGFFNIVRTVSSEKNYEIVQTDIRSFEEAKYFAYYYIRAENHRKKIFKLKRFNI